MDNLVSFEYYYVIFFFKLQLYFDEIFPLLRGDTNPRYVKSLINEGFIMHKFIICLLIFFYFISFNRNLYGFDLETVDSLNYQGKYEEALKLLKDNFNPNSPRAEILWRMGREIFEIAEAIPVNNKDRKISNFDQGVVLLKDYLEINNGSALDKARLIHWYTANYASKAKTIGALKALSIVPELFTLEDKAQKIDPTFSDPYFLKAKIDETLPDFLGGDKVRMGVNLSRSIIYNTDDLTVLVEGAVIFYDRNWSRQKKDDLGKKKYSSFH
jgi:hypothetical protein